jgi:hypothetical protein
MLNDDLDFEAIVKSSNWQSPSDYYQTAPERTQAIVSSVVASDERLGSELRNEYLPRLVREGTILDWKQADPAYITSGASLITRKTQQY